ncbi:hypothetical protein [Rubinisphaera sp.]|uniref:hypothetical protein n=1 Tax=Rubinisphaera sp. TaxID=2024857 RepID=UPI0025DE22BD|nr:hypothetical protein [Rubinisphaera sp.]
MEPQGKRHLFGYPLSAFGFQYTHLSPLTSNPNSFRVMQEQAQRTQSLVVHATAPGGAECS